MSQIDELGDRCKRHAPTQRVGEAVSAERGRVVELSAGECTWMYFLLRKHGHSACAEVWRERARIKSEHSTTSRSFVVA